MLKRACPLLWAILFPFFLVVAAWLLSLGAASGSELFVVGARLTVCRDAACARPLQLRAGGIYACQKAAARLVDAGFKASCVVVATDRLAI